MKTLTRSEAEIALINNECDTIQEMVENNDLSYVHDIFYGGHKGYANFSDEELKKEYYEQFNEKIEIIPDVA